MTRYRPAWECERGDVIHLSHGDRFQVDHHGFAGDPERVYLVGGILPGGTRVSGARTLPFARLAALRVTRA